MRSTLPLISGLFLVAACDAQATPAYEGEALFALRGSVEIEDTPANRDLIPAIAFHNQSVGRYDIVDVDVEGQFPAGFTLEVRAVPPDTALMQVVEREGEPELAVGLIAVTSPGHPESIKTTAFVSGGGRQCGDGHRCVTESYCTTAPDAPYVVQASPPGCYTEELLCDIQGQNCTLQSTAGDREIKYGFAETFTGVSSNYIVIYAPEDLGPGTVTADILGYQTLPAGYHLFRSSPLSPAAMERIWECLERADVETLRRFNEEQGTMYEPIKMFSDGCAMDDLGCVPDELFDAHDAIFDDVFFDELRCLALAGNFSRVDSPSDTPISIQITSDPSSQLEWSVTRP